MSTLRPKPLDTTPPPLTDALVEKPSPLALVDANVRGQWWHAVVRKVSYRLREDGALVRTAQQPIHTVHTSHEPLPETWGLPPTENLSMQTVPEARAWQSGTDVVIRAHAVAPKPVRELVAGAVVGKHLHRLQVFGRRRSVFAQGRVQFTEPELFERIPLRWELAYGGLDRLAMAQALAQLEQRMDAVEWRRSRAFFKRAFAQTVPLVYARNPVGMGYVADAVAEALDGALLPHIELAHDRLTPERFAYGRPLHWLHRPVPGGMDYVDLRMFPRSAMLGLPPPGWDCVPPLRQIAEVQWGQLPEDFCGGNFLTAEGEALNAVVHPDAQRCAATGLRLPRLQGSEPVSLMGLHAERPRWDFQLPSERPAFTVPGLGRLGTQLYQIFIDADAGRLELLWAAPWQADRALAPGEGGERLQHIQTHVERLS